MHPVSRIAASSALAAVVVAGLATGFLGAPPPSHPQTWDDISDYDGTKCPPDQLYDASDGSCAADTVTDNPDTSDDISDFDDTTCSPDQFYDATAGRCATTAATNDPQAPLQPNSAGISDPGTQCAETEMFSVPEMKCVPDLDTNDPRDIPKPEGENPTQYTVPRADDVRECAAGADPLNMCLDGPGPTLTPAPTATVVETADPEPDKTMSVIAPAAPTATPG